MHVILHIGSPKTGSTALQHALFAARGALRAHGVLYPVLSAAQESHNHGPLAMALFEERRLPRRFRFLDPARREGLLQETRQELAYQLGRYAPRCLVLSSEYFYRTVPLGAWAALLHEVLGEPPARVTVVCYLRRPLAQYLSDLQQTLYASHEVPPPKPLQMRSVLTSYRDTLPEAQLVVRPFAREALSGGDVLVDFAEQVLAPHAPVTLEAPPGFEANVSLSAEGMAVLRAYRKSFYPDDNDRFMRPSTELRRLLQEIDRALGRPRPALRTEIADVVDYSTDEALWLRDAFGVSFDGYDYARAGTVAPPDGARRYKLHDLVGIDPDGLRAVIDRLAAAEAWVAAHPRHGAWLERLRARVPRMSGQADTVEAGSDRVS
jgi:hypothetical protein